MRSLEKQWKETLSWAVWVMGSVGYHGRWVIMGCVGHHGLSGLSWAVRIIWSSYIPKSSVLKKEKLPVSGRSFHSTCWVTRGPLWPVYKQEGNPLGRTLPGTIYSIPLTSTSTIRRLVPAVILVAGFATIGPWWDSCRELVCDWLVM